MNKISQKRVTMRRFHYMAGTDLFQFEKLMSIVNPIEKLAFISKEAPSAGCVMDETTKEIFWRPKIGHLFVSADQEFKKYATPSGAYSEAVRIKTLMMCQIYTLKMAYQKRDTNKRIIREHYLSLNQLT